MNRGLPAVSKAFLDTTVLTDILLKSGELGLWSREAIKEYDEILLPVYAMKEFSSGPLSYWIWLYNKFALTKSLSKTILAISSMVPMKPRTAQTALEALSLCNNSIPISGMTEEENAEFYRQVLLGKIMRAWKKRRNVVPGTNVVDDLPCFTEGDPLLKQEDKTLNNAACKCHLRRGKDCCAAAIIKKHPDDIAALIKAIEGKSRREDVSRRAVLHKMLNTPKLSLNARECRNIGDAYFAIQAPRDSVILTTNGKDHKELADALGKQVLCPQDTP